MYVLSPPVAAQSTQNSLFSRMPRVIRFEVSALVSSDWTRFPMVANGRVQNGVVVLDNGVRLPEGQEVIVLAHATVSGALPMECKRQHGILDISTVGLGSVLRPLTSDDDLLGEMLEGRP